VRELYPPIEPFDDGYLKVSELHTVHYEQVGSPKGKKALFLHGGPGGGLDPDYRRYFDPAKWHLTLFDQRGSGKSTRAPSCARTPPGTSWPTRSGSASVSASTSGWSSAGAGAARSPSPTPRRTPNG